MGKREGVVKSFPTSGTYSLCVQGGRVGESPKSSHLTCFLLQPVSVRFSITCNWKNPSEMLIQFVSVSSVA